MKHLRTLVKLCAYGHLIFLFALLLLWYFLGERHWILILFRYAPPLLYLGLWLLVSFAHFLVERKVAMGLAMIALLVIVPGFLRPAWNLSAPQSSQLKVISLNIHAGTFGTSRIAQLVKASGVDIIGFQEARPPLAKPDWDPAIELTQKLPSFHWARGGLKGELLTLSVFPIESSQEHELNEWSRVLDCRVQTEQGPLRVLNVHCVMGNPGGLSTSGLEKSARARHEQARAIVDLVKEDDTPTILLGDFNSPPNSVAHQILSRAFEDAFKQSGLGMGWTFPSRFPLLRIDYIWSRGLTSTNCRVGKERVSDHRALLGEFTTR